MIDGHQQEMHGRDGVPD